jgi:thioredoxin-related protein
MILKSVFFSAVVVCLYGQGWHTNMEEAKELARKEHKHILLNFSGSDWCGPCILLRKDILDQPDFLQMADTALILVNADFPRNKKNQPTPDQQRLNDQMADRYNSRGQFPLTLLLTADGKVLKQWEGNPGVSPEVFSSQVRAAINADK